MASNKQKTSPPQPGSPNHCWQSAGYKITRTECLGESVRAVYSPDGELVALNLPHEGEMEIIRRLGIFTES
jgi:hypothetical protein